MPRTAHLEPLLCIACGFYKTDHRLKFSNGNVCIKKKYMRNILFVLGNQLIILGGSDKSGIFFFLLSNDTAQLKIIRFD
jgi:hypothetical protein